MSRSLSSFINVKKKKSPKNRTDSHKKYKEFLTNKNKLKSVKNPINTLMKDSLKQPSKLRFPKVTKHVKFVDTSKYDKPEISIDTKKVTIEKDPMQPIFKIDRDEIDDKPKVNDKPKRVRKKLTKRKKRKARKARKVSFTIKAKRRLVPYSFKILAAKVVFPEPRKPNNISTRVFFIRPSLPQHQWSLLLMVYQSSYRQ